MERPAPSLAEGAASDRVYWIEYGGFDALKNYQDDGRLMSLLFDGDEPTVVATGLQGPVQLGATEDYAYVILDRSSSPQGPLQLARIGFDDGAVELLQALPVGLDGYRSGGTIDTTIDWFRRYFASSLGYVFWLSDGTVYRLAEVSPALPQSFLDLGEHPADGLLLFTMLADDSQVYLQDATGITSVPVTGGTPAPLWTSSDSERYSSSLSVVGDYFHAYEWGDDRNYFSRLPKVGGSFKRLGAATLQGQTVFHLAQGHPIRTDGTSYVGAFRTLYFMDYGWSDCTLVEGMLADSESTHILAVSPRWRDEERRYREDWRAWDATATTVYLGYENQLYRVARQF